MTDNDMGLVDVTNAAGDAKDASWALKLALHAEILDMTDSDHVDAIHLLANDVHSRLVRIERTLNALLKAEHGAKVMPIK